MDTTPWTCINISILKTELETVVGRRTTVKLEAGIREAVNTVR